MQLTNLIFLVLRIKKTDIRVTELGVLSSIAAKVQMVIKFSATPRSIQVILLPSLPTNMPQGSPQDHAQK